eukprot:4566578-Prymnesium_polylepis.1
MGACYCSRRGVPGGWCILPDVYSTSISYIAVVSARKTYAQPILSCTSHHRLGMTASRKAI